MIQNFKNIKNVGRFKNFKGTDDNVSFARNTFIFGNNTQGKSTLASILKSLTTNNNDYIIGRRTFGGNNQNVVLGIDSIDYIFNGSWNKNYKIKIFDNDYIIENIYSGNLITEDKQRKIASIILGENGRIKEKQWLDANKEIYDNANKEKEITRLYKTAFDDKIVRFPDFLNLPKNNNIFEEIRKKEKKLASFKNQQRINLILQNIIKEIDNFSLDRSELEKTLEVNQEIITNHFSNNLKTNKGALNFVSSGLSVMKDDICPFCSQPILAPATQLIEAYNVLFSENYKKIKNSIENAFDFLDNWDFEKNILTYSSKLNNLGLSFNVSSQIEDISKYRKEFIRELNTKKNDLTYCINFDSFGKIKKSLDILKDYVKNLNEKYTKTIDKKTLQSLGRELEKKKIQKRRYEHPWDELSVKYLALRKKYEEDLKPNEESAFENKNNYAKNVLSNYQKIINEILEKLGAGFKLTNFSIPQNRREAIKLFGLKFNNSQEKIPLLNSNSGYNLKNTLSDSDKRLLAFAFFVADIKNIADLSEYIVVLDDPMSSFDFDRKRQTIKILKDKLYNEEGDKPQQLIILTHEPNFFTFLNEYFTSDKKFLRIKYFAQDTTSKIIPCDINEEFLKGEHYKNLDYYKKCSNGEIDEIDLSDLRVVLEEIIKSKYYLEIPKTTINSGGIIFWYKDNKGNIDINDKIKYIFLSLSHHAQSNGISDNDYTENEKRDIVKDFLDLITKI